MDITNTQDIIDSRDVIARIEELEDMTITQEAHTPGPWHVSDGYKSAKHHAVCAGALIVAKITGFGYPAGQGWSEQSAANTRLIAAAPELLHALQALIVAVTCHDSRGEKLKLEKTLDRENPTCISFARATIAKARGK